MTQIELTETAQLAQKYINTTNKSIFLTGKAGTGKTTFLKHIIENTHKNTIVIAPTGIAAINAGGATIHSLLQLPFGAFLPDNNVTFSDNIHSQINTPRSLISKLQLNHHKRTMLREMELLIIDEVSMLRPDILDAIDTVLKNVKRNSKPFGGTQLLFIGDLLQLPPVIKDAEWEVLQAYYKSKFFFSAHVLFQSPPVYIELDKIYRQSDQEFISILNRLRDNKIDERDVKFLNRFYQPNFEADPERAYINLTTHNRKADTINNNSLEKLNGAKQEYLAEVDRDFQPNSFPIEEKLTLKKGAQVMFIKNDPSGQQLFFNGKIGKISSLTKNSIQVSFTDGSPTVDVEKYTWENKRYSLNKETNEIEEKVMGTFTHYPLRLAWAITIHKSQGLTFENAILDVSSAFAPGQVYVALSRLTSLKGLILSEPFSKQSFGISQAVEDFNGSKLPLEQQKKDLQSSTSNYLKEYIVGAFNFDTLQWHIDNHVSSYNKTENKSAKQKYKDWALSFHQKFKETKIIADKFNKQLLSITAQEKTDYTFLTERMAAAITFFDKVFSQYQDSINNHITELSGKTGIKGYQTELRDLRDVFHRNKLKLHKAKALVSAIGNEQELTKDDIKQIGNANKQKKIEPTISKTKVDTKKLTLDLFRKGKSIEEIATERGIKEQTIETHLSWAVQHGKIKATEFLPEEQVKEILAMAKKLDTQYLSPIKEEFGNKYNYLQLRMAMAHKIHEESFKKNGEA